MRWPLFYDSLFTAELDEGRDVFFQVEVDLVILYEFGDSCFPGREDLCDLFFVVGLIKTTASF